MFGSTNTKLWSGGPQYGYIMTEYPEGSQCQITRELDGTVLKARGSGSNWAFALPEVIGFKIPKEYQEVEYIESTGTQYIDTGVPARVQIRCEIDAQSITTNPTDQTLLGGNGSGTQNNVIVVGYNHDSNYKSYYYFVQSGFVDATRIVDTNRHSIIVNFESGNEQFIVDGVVKKQYTSTFTATTSSTTLHLFRRANGNNPFYGKLYALRIYDYLDGGKMIREFIPCYRKSDYVAGLWDTVGKSFYTNIGTGVFVVGPDTGGDKWTAYCTDGENEAERKVNIIYNGDIKSAKLNYRVPIEYQAVEYLQTSSAGPRITVQTSSEDVYDAEKEYEFYAKFAPNSTALKAVFAYLLSPAQLNYLTYPTNRDEVYIGTNPVATLSASTLDAVSEVKIVAKNGAYSVSRNGSVIYSGSYSGTLPVGGSIGLLDAASGTDTTYRFIGRFIEFYQKVDGQFIHHIVPCYRKSDGVAGMWDQVDKVFYINTGTGTFTVGPDM